MSKIEKCVNALEIVITDLRAEGIETLFIVNALSELCVKATVQLSQEAGAQRTSTTKVYSRLREFIKEGGKRFAPPSEATD